jgi:DNA repair protein RecO (recombination protein O)
VKFSDQGIIISKRNYGERSLIIKIFSNHHGIFNGFVTYAKSAKNLTIIQPGNLVSFEWRSRIEENLGQFCHLDLIKSFSSKIIFDIEKLTCFNSLISIIDSSFLEREEQANLFDSLNIFLEDLASEHIIKKKYLANYIKLELEILKILGYELDLSCCVVTNQTTNLTFVSPKSARAVSFEAGQNYQNKLLKLPSFLLGQNIESDQNQLLEGFKLSGYFLQKHIFSCDSNKASPTIYKIRNKVQNLIIEFDGKI